MEQFFVNRKGIPKQMKTSSKKKGKRGTVRRVRQGNVVFLQWIDTKTVSFISSMHVKANEHVYCNRQTKVNGIYRRIRVKQPTLVRAYNQSMSGVDKSDQLIGKYNTLRKTYQLWKT